MFVIQDGGLGLGVGMEELICGSVEGFLQLTHWTMRCLGLGPRGCLLSGH